MTAVRGLVLGGCLLGGCMLALGPLQHALAQESARTRAGR